MLPFRRAFATAIMAATLAATLAITFGAPPALAACVNKAASGTNTTADGARFQAWEAVLQATDWGSWASFMSSGAKVGSAPGYKVSKVRSSCGKGGLGFSCRMQATLCN